MPQNKKNEKKVFKEASNEAVFSKNLEEIIGESKESQDQKRELLKEQDLIEKELRREIEKMDLDDSLKQQAQIQAQKIKNLGEEEKIKSLLKIAKLKGVIYSVNVAKKMDDPYILDTLHDILAKEGYYKKFLK